MEKQINELPQRKHPRMKFFDYSENGGYFVTICTQNRKKILSEIVDGSIVLTKYGEIANTQILELKKRYSFLKIENYVIMPNHIHLLFVFEREENKNSVEKPSQSRLAELNTILSQQITKQSSLQNHIPSLQGVVSTFKSFTTRMININYNYGKIFQTSFYEHVIRNDEDFINTWEYIENNPLKWEEDELYKN